MTVTAGDLGKTVVAQWGAGGGVRAIGEMVGYQSEPTAYIKTAKGELVSWVASLCREAAAEEAAPEAAAPKDEAREFTSFDAARSTAHTPNDVWDLVYPKSENLDQRVHNAQIIEAYTRGKISITKYRGGGQ
jgi:hypothetical protein